MYDRRTIGTGTSIPVPVGQYFGGKSRIAAAVWQRFGDVPGYVEPFFGSGAVLFARPTPPGIETVNDMDANLCNFWRAIQHDPDATADAADYPVNECDLHARHAWLVGRKESIREQLEGDPMWFDARAAGWWAYVVCSWIGSGVCSGEGPWHVVDGRLVNVKGLPDGVQRQLPHLGDAGKGINRQLPHLGNAGKGVNRPVEGTCAERRAFMRAWFGRIADRLRNVRVACGDWTRVCGPSVTRVALPVAVFLDPPYSAEAGRQDGLYAHEDLTVAHDVREWAIEHGTDPNMRIALCGYDGEHEMPPDWECLAWKANGGYGGQKRKCGTVNQNAKRERVWFSPACLKPSDDLFAGPGNMVCDSEEKEETE